MSTQVIKVQDLNGSPNDGICRKVKAAIDKVRDRAYALFEQRRYSGAQAVDDWLRAEQELFEIPASTLSDKEGVYDLKLSAPGFLADQLNVAVDPYSVTVYGAANEYNHGLRFTETSSRELFRRIELHSPIDIDRVIAGFENGVLTISLPKVGAAVNEELAAAHAA